MQVEVGLVKIHSVTRIFVAEDVSFLSWAETQRALGDGPLENLRWGQPMLSSANILRSRPTVIACEAK